MKAQAVISNQTVTPNSGDAQFAVLDLFKMLAAAIACGIVFSLFAAGLTLLLMSTAEAHHLPANNLASPAQQATALTNPAIESEVAAPAGMGAAIMPGLLKMGDNGASAALDAMERDWRIRINSNVAEVRVMQTFLMPADGPAVAHFQAVLPSGAVLASFKVDATDVTQTGELMAHQLFTEMDRAEVRNETRARHKKRRLTVWINDRHIESDSILNLTLGETVTVEYSYNMPVMHSNHSASLNLVLQADTASLHAAPSQSANNATSNITGTVWVEWLNTHPKKVVSASNDIYVDQTARGVAGASWFSADLSSHRQFNINWD